MKGFVFIVTIALLFYSCQNQSSKEAKGRDQTENSNEGEQEEDRGFVKVTSPSDFQFAFVKGYEVVLREQADPLSNVMDSLKYLDRLEIVSYKETATSTWFQVNLNRSDLSGWVLSDGLSLFLEEPKSIDYYLDLFGSGFEKIENTYSVDYVKKEGPASYKIRFEEEAGFVIVKHTIEGELEMDFDAEVTYRMSGESLDFLFKEYNGYRFYYPSGNFLVLHFDAFVGLSWLKVFDIGKKENMDTESLGDLVYPEFSRPVSYSLKLTREQSRNGAELKVEESNGYIYAKVVHPKDQGLADVKYVFKEGAFVGIR